MQCFIEQLHTRQQRDIGNKKSIMAKKSTDFSIGTPLALNLFCASNLEIPSLGTNSLILFNFPVALKNQFPQLKLSHFSGFYYYIFTFLDSWIHIFYQLKHGQYKYWTFLLHKFMRELLLSDGNDKFL